MCALVESARKDWQQTHPGLELVIFLELADEVAHRHFPSAAGWRVQNDDAFSVLLAAMLAPSDAQRVGAKLLASLHAPFKVSGQDVAVAASLGIAQYPEDGNQPQVLLQRAVGLAMAGAAQGRVGFANFGEAGGSAASAANDD